MPTEHNELRSKARKIAASFLIAMTAVLCWRRQAMPFDIALGYKISCHHESYFAFAPQRHCNLHLFISPDTRLSFRRTLLVFLMHFKLIVSFSL
jgi:hypothetical protein